MNRALFTVCRKDGVECACDVDCHFATEDARAIHIRRAEAVYHEDA